MDVKEHERIFNITQEKEHERIFNITQVKEHERIFNITQVKEQRFYCYSTFHSRSMVFSNENMYLSASVFSCDVF
jgi:hypothetical protein